MQLKQWKQFDATVCIPVAKNSLCNRLMTHWSTKCMKDLYLERLMKKQDVNVSNLCNVRKENACKTKTLSGFPHFKMGYLDMSQRKAGCCFMKSEVLLI